LIGEREERKTIASKSLYQDNMDDLNYPLRVGNVFQNGMTTLDEIRAFGTARSVERVFFLVDPQHAF
jgi:hypothetical protein